MYMYVGCHGRANKSNELKLWYLCTAECGFESHSWHLCPYLYALWRLVACNQWSHNFCKPAVGYQCSTVLLLNQVRFCKQQFFGQTIIIVIICCMQVARPTRPGPNFIELLSTKICSACNFFLGKNRITNQTSICYILLVTGFQPYTDVC